MPFEYDNALSPFYSEASSADSLLASDWTVGGVDTLSLFIQGNPADLVEVSPSHLIVSGAGADIFGTTDEFRMVYKQLPGDGSIVARVASLENTHAFAKAGVMVRASLQGNSPNAMIYVSPENGVRLQQRMTYDEASSSDTETASEEQKAVAAPAWIKIERSGSVVTAWYATDEAGTNWVVASGSPQDVTLLNGPAFIGLAVCSHVAGTSTVAEFTDVATVGANGNWTAEAIGVAQPTNSAEPMYVKVTDSSNQSKTVMHENTAATQIGAWTQWTIPLSSFTGVNLSNVRNLAIGVGNGSSAGGTGIIYVDDVRLIRSGN